VARDLARTPQGNAAAISAHNCYRVGSDPASSLATTLDLIHAAQQGGADLIELDIKSEGGILYVDHNDEGTTEGAHLGAVLADPALRAGDQILFIESKETHADEDYVAQLLSNLVENGYGTAGRPVVIRSFTNIRNNLTLTRDALEDASYDSLRPWVKLNELFNKQQAPSLALFESLISQSSRDGFHGVEFHYQDSNLFPKIAHAHGLGLGVNLWTIPDSLGEVFVAALREEADALTVDYPVDKARAVVEDSNLVEYMRRKNQSTVTRRTIENQIAAGYFVTAVVRFRNLDLSQGRTVQILGDGETGAFTLEMHNPEGEGEAVLRFGARVGSYVYGSIPLSQLNTSDSFFLTGAYDGDGGVWLWVNHSDEGLTRGQAQGPVRAVEGPAIDNSGSTYGDSVSRFPGRVDQYQVQTWGPH